MVFLKLHFSFVYNLNNIIMTLFLLFMLINIVHFSIFTQYWKLFVMRFLEKCTFLYVFFVYNLNILKKKCWFIKSIDQVFAYVFLFNRLSCTSTAINGNLILLAFFMNRDIGLLKYDYYVLCLPSFKVLWLLIDEVIDLFNMEILCFRLLYVFCFLNLILFFYTLFSVLWRLWSGYYAYYKSHMRT